MPIYCGIGLEVAIVLILLTNREKGSLFYVGVVHLN